jgi:uncharacterized protein with PQ loop repeat
METIGWIGSILFAICAIPQVLQCAKDGHARGLNSFFLGCWFFGELFTIVYIFPKGDMPLLFNYILNLFFVVIMIRYKIWERKENEI